MQALLEGSGDFASVRIFPEADHSFRVQTDGLVWPTSVQGYPDVVIDWTVRVTGTEDSSASESESRNSTTRRVQINR